MNYRFYFQWADEDDSFDPSGGPLLDEVVIGWRLSRKEGDFVTLEITIKNPDEPLLAAGRKRWAYFAYDTGPLTDVVVRFFGQVIAVPDNIAGATITYHLLARPSDYFARKKTLANSLRELPWYDRAFIDPSQLEDDDHVLETRSAFWFTDPITHDLSISHCLTGDEVVEFDASEHIQNRFDAKFGTPPVSAVELTGEMTWTQQATGTIDLSDYIATNWDNEGTSTGISGPITSFTMGEDQWIKNGASLRDGWTVFSASAYEIYNLEPRQRITGGKIIITWPDGEQTSAEATQNDDVLETPPGSLTYPSIVTRDDVNVSRSGPVTSSSSEVTSFSRTLDFTDSVLPLHHINVTLVAGYTAARPMKEIVKVRLTADMQPVITMPDEDDIVILPTQRTVNLSEPFGEDTADAPAIGDPASRSYVCQDRGRLSLEYLVLLARAHILLNSRAVSVTLSPVSFHRMREVDCDVNVLVENPDFPTGEALGKVTSWDSAYDRGTLTNSITMGCTPGRAGAISAVAGDPEYVEDDYIDSTEDYQQYIGARLLVADVTDVGYEPPLFAPNDDGLDFISGLDVEGPGGVIEQALTVENTAAEQRAYMESGLSRLWDFSTGKLGLDPEILDRRTAYLEARIAEVPTIARFGLKSMKASFETSYEIESDLKMPQMVNFETSA